MVGPGSVHKQEEQFIASAKEQMILLGGMKVGTVLSPFAKEQMILLREIKSGTSFIFSKKIDGVPEGRGAWSEKALL